MSFNELSFQGVIPEDQYLKLPRVLLNKPEVNPHLSNHHSEGGKIHIRSFRIPKKDLTHA